MQFIKRYENRWYRIQNFQIRRWHMSDCGRWWLYDPCFYRYTSLYKMYRFKMNRDRTGVMSTGYSSIFYHKNNEIKYPWCTTIENIKSKTPLTNVNSKPLSHCVQEKLSPMALPTLFSLLMTYPQYFERSLIKVACLKHLTRAATEHNIQLSHLLYKGKIVVRAVCM